MPRSVDVTDILLVDDSDEDVEMTQRELRRYRVVNRVYRARDGEEALRFLFESNTRDGKVGWKTIRLVLLDFRMPKVNGLEFLSKLRSHQDTCDIPVLMLTGTANQPALDQALEIGAQGILIKPLELPRLIDCLRSLRFDIVFVNRPENVPDDLRGSPPRS
jgi:CheY-like chemotaxis protein